ncbi:MAG: non-canonical purine NTP pyrophosphatase, RdgB/HAM1 family [Flammeovirgaceae bacterium]|nr:non-canonical purine NTP pyrophosphatase, RdgB/HAM1 family [Flammeovirgaceae bacterium]
MMELLFATYNSHKLNEIRNALGSMYTIQGLGDLNEKEIPETGNTLEENSLIKAEYIFKKYQKACFSDDTGLEVSALNNEPGVFSDRYAGSGNSEDNIDLLLANLTDQKDRKARFKTIITYFDEKGKQFIFEGVAHGKIILEKKGIQGFGYDPIFQPNGFERTFAQMSLHQKNKISHRGIALKKLIAHLISK